MAHSCFLGSQLPPTGVGFLGWGLQIRLDQWQERIWRLMMTQVIPVHLRTVVSPDTLWKWRKARGSSLGRTSMSLSVKVSCLVTTCREHPLTKHCDLSLGTHMPLEEAYLAHMKHLQKLGGQTGCCCSNTCCSIACMCNIMMPSTFWWIPGTSPRLTLLSPH